MFHGGFGFGGTGFGPFGAGFGGPGFGGGFGGHGFGWSGETPWFRWRLGLLDFDQGLVGPFRSVEDGFELCGR